MQTEHLSHLDRRRFLELSLKLGIAGFLAGTVYPTHSHGARRLTGDESFFRANAGYIEHVLEVAGRKGGDLSEVFLEQVHRHHITYRDGRIVNARRAASEGVGVRILVENRSAFAFAHGLKKGDAVRAAKAARKKIHASTRKNIPVTLPRKDFRNLEILEQVERQNRLSAGNRLQLLQRLEDIARKSSNLITRVDIEYLESVRNVIVANSRGIFFADAQPMIALSVTTFAETTSRRCSAEQIIARKTRFEFFSEAATEHLAAASAEECVHNLAVKPVSAGRYPVILSEGAGGRVVFALTETLFTGQNALEDRSPFARSLNHLIASTLVTLVDNGNFSGAPGSSLMDDEGTPTARTAIIQNGKLETFLTDIRTAAPLGLPLTGNARRASYSSEPAPAVTNVFLEAGKETPKDILRDTPEGIYCKNLADCTVDPLRGIFTARTKEAYTIKNGYLQHAIQDVEIHGTVHEFFGGIDRIGDEVVVVPAPMRRLLKIPMGYGQPTIRIRSLQVRPIAS